VLPARLRRRVLFGLATSAAFERAVRAVPAATQAAERAARRYVAGPDADAAIATVRRLHAARLRASVDLFGERAGPGEADATTAAYVELCGRLAAAAPPGTFVSLDLSHIAFGAHRLAAIAAAVPPGARLQVGAEEAAVTDRVLDLVLDAARDGAPVEATLQANLRRSPADADRLAAAGVPVRLVKGAYVEDARDALPWGPPTDAAYAALAHRLHAAGADVALATHDARLRTTLPDARLELLLGVRPADAADLAAAGRDVRIYVPYGAGWFRYLMRRRAEAQGA
jgi:proline dehydrogenase